MTAPERSPAWLIVILACAGMLVTGYLTAVAMTGGGAAFCVEGSGCEVIQSSRWSVLLGLPIALWGFALYLTIAVIAWRMPPRLKRWRRLNLLALIGVAVSVYLTVTGLVFLDALCAWCLVSFGIITAIFVVTFRRRPDSAPGVSWPAWTVNRLTIAVAVAAALFVWQNDLLQPENPRLQALAIHLDESGAKFYGAFWCPACQQQKRLFGASADRLPYVECNPHGRGQGLAEACVVDRVSSFPTWIIEGRRYEGVIEPETLARHSGFDWDN